MARPGKRAEVIVEAFRAYHARRISFADLCRTIATMRRNG